MVSKGRSGQANASEPADRNKRPFDLARRWNVARFLFCGGTLLVTLGLAGVLGLLSSLSRTTLFNPPHWINWFHLSFGGVVLAVAMIGDKRLQLGLAVLAAIAGTTLGVVDFVLGPNAAPRHGTAPLTDPSDPIAHLAVGMLAIWALRNSRREGRTA